MSEVCKTQASNEIGVENVPTPILMKRGRKPKYANDAERKEAKRIQNKAYRERKKHELVVLRRLASGSYQQQIQQLKLKPEGLTPEEEATEIINNIDEL